MQIYMESNLVYSFDRRWMFRPGYIARNIKLSQKHKRHDENSMDRGDSLLIKIK